MAHRLHHSSCGAVWAFPRGQDIPSRPLGKTQQRTQFILFAHGAGHIDEAS